MSGVTERGKIGLFKLPLEMLEKIGDELDYESSLNLRLTHSVLKTLIDTYVGVNFELNPTKCTTMQLDFVSDMCLSNVTVRNLLGEEDTNGLRKYFNNEYSFDDIFCFPHFLRKIKLEGKISVNFLFDVLTQCRNLECMDILLLSEPIDLKGNLCPLLLKEEFKTEYNFKPKEKSNWLPTLHQKTDIFRQIQLKRLKKIAVVCPVIMTNATTLLNAMILLKCIRSENLERIAVLLVDDYEFSAIDYFHALMIITDFVLAHVETIKDVTILLDLMRPGPNRPNHPFYDLQKALDDTYQGNVDTVQIISTLEKQFKAIGKMSKITYLNMGVKPNFLWNYWLSLIDNLRLVTLRIKGIEEYQMIINCGGRIANSYYTLKRLQLIFVCGPTNNFDLSGIENFVCLQEVYVFNRPRRHQEAQFGDIAPNNGPFEPNLKNVHLAPAGLKALFLANVVVASEDLNKTLEKQMNLECLVILHMSTANPENGTDSKCLERIFGMRSLQCCLMKTFVSKTIAEYDKIIQMMEFQMNASDKAVALEVEKDNPIVSRAFVLELLMANIVSNETFCPYLLWREVNRIRLPGQVVNLFKRIQFWEVDPYTF